MAIDVRTQTALALHRFGFSPKAARRSLRLVTRVRN